MAEARYLPILLLIQSLSASVVFPATLTLVNECSYTVWPGILSGAGTAELSTTGFVLNPGGSVPVSVPPSWSGRLWGRTFCSTVGTFTCVTGDCGTGDVGCAGKGAAPPVTLAEFTLNGAGGLDFYDVSLVDGYNLPMLVAPHGGAGGNCSSTGCLADLNESCPSELEVVNAASTTATTSWGGGGACVACKSACEAFGDPRYCCSGAYATPQTCAPTSYSEFFKSACPQAYSYAYDDGSSTFTCASADYVVTFCPSASASKKSKGGQITAPGSVSLVSSDSSFSYTPAGVTCTLMILFAAIPQLWRQH